MQVSANAGEKFLILWMRSAAWAERKLAAPTDRQQRAVFGYSNGGVFAATMGIRHPERYGHILAFSLGVQPRTPTAVRELSSDFYLVAGTLEEGFHTRPKESDETCRRHVGDWRADGKRGSFREEVLTVR